MIVWSDNQIPKFSEGYGYTPDRLWDFIGSSGLPIRRTNSKKPLDNDRVNFGNESGINIGHDVREDLSREVIINHSVADEFVRSTIYSVGFTFWETNLLPGYWVDMCNRMDEIWTCSQSMVDVFKNSGVQRPIYEFKLGVDPKIYYPKLRKPHDTFTFLSIGSPSSRKNSQMTIDAFLKLFNGNHNFKLIYKSNGDPDGRIFHGDIMSGLSHPQIEVITDEVSHEELGHIYDMADCVVFPTSGEGWGNLPFQAIAKGIPTICTNVLACTEFANMSLPLDFEWSTWRMFGRYEGCGEWAKPNFNDLCDKMLYVADNHSKVAEKTYENAIFINENMTWEHVSQKYIDRCWQILRDIGHI